MPLSSPSKCQYSAPRFCPLGPAPSHLFSQTTKERVVVSLTAHNAPYNDNEGYNRDNFDGTNYKLDFPKYPYRAEVYHEIYK